MTERIHYCRPSSYGRYTMYMYLSYASLEERGYLSAGVLYFQEVWECGANENGAETESDLASVSEYVEGENESVVEATIDCALCHVLSPSLARDDGVAGDWGIGPTVAEVKKTDCRGKVVCLSLFPSLPPFSPSLSLIGDRERERGREREKKKRGYGRNGEERERGSEMER